MIKKKNSIVAKLPDIHIYLNLFCNFLTVIMLTNPELLNYIILNMKALIIWLFYVISNFTYCCIQSMQNKTLNVCYTWQRICNKKNQMLSVGCKEILQSMFFVFSCFSVRNYLLFSDKRAHVKDININWGALLKSFLLLHLDLK